MAIVIITNNTGSNLSVEDMGVTLGGNETRNLTDYFDFVDCTESEDLKILTAAATITVSDGSNNLSIVKGLEHLEIESVHQDYIQDEEGTGIVTSTLAYVGVALNTQFQLTTTYTNTVYDSLEYQNDTDIIEWDTGNPERILIKEDGDYRIDTSYFVRANTPNFIDTEYRIVKNGSIVISGEQLLNTYTGEIQQILVCVTVPLLAGDYITSQRRVVAAGDDVDIMQTRFNITKQEGVAGADGPPGGSTITIQDDGVIQVTATDTINFRGDGVIVTPGTGNTALVDIQQMGFEPRIVQLLYNVGLVNVNTAAATALVFDTQEVRDTSTYTWSSTTNPTRIYVLRDGWYAASWGCAFTNGDTSRKNIRGFMRRNGSIPQVRTYGAAYVRNATDDYGVVGCAGGMIDLAAGDYVEVMTIQEGSGGTVSTVPRGTWINLTIMVDGQIL